MKSKTVIGFFLLFFTVSLYAEVNFAHFNMREVVRNLPEGHKLEKELQRKLAELQNKVMKSQKKLREDQGRFQISAAKLDKKKRSEWRLEIARKFKESKALKEHLNNKESDYRKTMFLGLINQIKKAVKEVAKIEGYLVVLEREQSGILYMRDELDITFRVVARVKDYR